MVSVTKKDSTPSLSTTKGGWMSHSQPSLHPHEDVQGGDISVDTTVIMPSLAALLETALEHSQNRCYPPPAGLRLCRLHGGLFHTSLGSRMESVSLEWVPTRRLLMQCVFRGPVSTAKGVGLCNPTRPRPAPIPSAVSGSWLCSLAGWQLDGIPRLFSIIGPPTGMEFLAIGLPC